MLQAAITGLQPGKPFTLALSNDAAGAGQLEPLAMFMTNPAGAAIVDTVGPIRQVVEDDTVQGRRYLVIASGAPGALGAVVQVQQ